MKISKIKYACTSNGVGIRTAVFVSGCHHACKGCFNKEAWNRNYGETYTDEIESQILSSLASDYVSGLSLLGGEPFEDYNLEALIGLCQLSRKLYPDKTIWIYSGYTYEEIMANKSRRKLLELCDILVDGKYEESLYSPSLKFKGSSNQRIINVPASAEKQTIVLGE